MNTLRCESSNIEFPLILGRDFVGTVVGKGLEIKNSEYNVGEKVWGVIPVHHQGCHCEYVTVDKSHVSKKPATLSDVEASAVLYSGLTAWSGLFITGQLAGSTTVLCPNSNAKVKKVLVLGASGGVGSIAVQILRAEGVEVVATCSTDALPLVTSFGASKVVDYTAPESDSTLISESPYNIILDCAGKGSDYASSLPWTFGSYITFKSPLMKNFDAHGMIGGGLKNIKDLLAANAPVISGKGNVKWGYFWPSKDGMQYLKKLAVDRKLITAIDSTYSVESLPEAYQRIQDGHVRGKVVIDFTKTNQIN